MNSRSYRIAKIFILIFGLITFGVLGYQGFSCEWGGDPFACGVAENGGIPLIVASCVYLGIVEIVQKYSVSKASPIILSLIYLFGVISFLMAPAILEGGLLYRVVKGGAFECVALSKGIYKDECYIKLAVKNSDYSYCRNIEYDNGKCFASFVQSKESLSLCGESGTPSLCKLYSAVNLSDPEMCEMIDDQVLTSRCFMEVGIKLNRKDICLRASPPGMITPGCAQSFGN